MIERLAAPLSWIKLADHTRLESAIEHVYGKRSALVHNGLAELVEPEDVVYTDVLLYNLLWNILWHRKQLGSKDAVIELAERVKAEKVLGIAHRSRPRTLACMRLPRSQGDYQWMRENCEPGEQAAGYLMSLLYHRVIQYGDEWQHWDVGQTDPDLNPDWVMAR